MNKRDVPLPLSYRSELLQRVMPALGAGECCSLVGTSGAGKSNLVRFLQRPDVQETYWDSEPTWVIGIDTHSLVFGEAPEEFSVIELLIHRLIREAERRALPSEVMAELDAKYARLVEQPNALLALRYLERICGLICERLGIRLIFVFDQFEDLWQSLNARLFLNLRHLRDEFKYQLVYLVMTRERLGRVRQRARDDLPAVEAFCELFSSHTYGLGMYTEPDAAFMLTRIANRRDTVVSDDVCQRVISLSGGHSGLLRAVFWAGLHCSTPLEPTDLLAVEAVADECAKLWNDLLPEEQLILQGIARGTQAPDNGAVTDLLMKGLLIGTPPALFSPLFAAYVVHQSGEDALGVVIEPRMRQVWLDGRPLGKVLSPLEFRLLEYLARHTGQICSRDDILRELYNEQAYNANDERLDTLLRRLRETLNEDARKPRFLHTHRGVGIQLLHGRIRE